VRKIIGSQTLEAFLSDRVMLDVVSDYTETKDAKGQVTRVVYLMPYGRETFYGLARLNLSNLVMKGVSIDDPLCKEAVRLLAQMMCVISNRTADVDRIMQELIAAARENPRNFFVSNTFRIMLPPVAKIDFNGVIEILNAEKDVMRSV
jgi:hypothetical protein